MGQCAGFEPAFCALWHVSAAAVGKCCPYECVVMSHDSCVLGSRNAARHLSKDAGAHVQISSGVGGCVHAACKCVQAASRKHKHVRCTSSVHCHKCCSHCPCGATPGHARAWRAGAQNTILTPVQRRCSAGAARRERRFERTMLRQPVGSDASVTACCAHGEAHGDPVNWRRLRGPIHC